MEDENVIEASPSPINTGQTFADHAADELARQALYNSTRSVADHTGELVDKVHAALGDKHMARVVSMSEPVTGVQGLVVLKPNGQIEALHDAVFDEYRSRPKRYSGQALVSRIESFVAHVNRFKDEQSALYALDKMDNPRLTAVLDYHEGKDYPIHGPRFGEHRTLFQFPLSEEWKAWKAKDGQKMGLTAFAEFIEDRFIDVEHVTDASKLNGDIQKLVGTVGAASLASPSALIELSRGLKVHIKDEVTNAASIASGEVEVQFKSEHQDKYGNKLVVPSLFVLNIPVFARGEIYRVAARLRYRVKDGEMSFWYELWGLDRVFELAFTEVCEKAQAETALPLFYGSPE